MSCPLRPKPRQGDYPRLPDRRPDFADQGVLRCSLFGHRWCVITSDEGCWFHLQSERQFCRARTPAWHDDRRCFDLRYVEKVKAIATIRTLEDAAARGRSRVTTDRTGKPPDWYYACVDAGHDVSRDYQAMPELVTYGCDTCKRDVIYRPSAGAE